MFGENEEMISLIREQIGSNGEKGWPVAVRDRIAFPRSSELIVSNANVAVTFLWTMRDSVLPNLEKENLAIATNFYTPAGLQGMVRNILGNPFIRYIILLGEEYSSKSEGDKISELTSANAIRAFFERGVNADRKIDGFENAVYFDKNIPLEMIEKIRQNIKLIDLNKTMPYANLSEKIQEANRLIRTLEKQEPFLEKPQTFDYEAMDESFPYEGGPIIVHGNNIPNAWIKMISNIYRYGRKNLMNANTDRWVKEINNMTVVIHNPQDMDLSVNPFLVPLTIEKIEAYKKEILSSILPEEKAYTYGNELRAYHYPSAKEIQNLVNSTEYKDFEFGQGNWIDTNVNYIGEKCEINQIKDIIDVLKRDPYSKACVAVTWHPSKELMRKHKSSPCLVLIQAMVQDEKLNLTVFFRSHDMTQGWPENAYGCAAIQNEIAKEIGVECGIMTIISGSAQIYNNYYQQVEQMLQNYSENLLNCNDKKGNYQIKVQNNEIILNLLHPENGKVLEEIKGNSAYEIKDKISIHGLETGHAIYLGTELAMAEMAIKKEIDYEQDETIRRLGEIEDKEKELVFNSERKISKKDASGILTDKKINEKIMSGEISINPFNKKCVQPVSYDLHLGNEFKLFKNYACEIIDTKKSVSGMMETIKLEEGQPFILHPKSFALALIKEKVGVNSRHVGRLEGKSSLARLGLVIHATAGHLNPGHCLNLTLELFNASSLPIKIYPGMEIAQIMFETLNEPCEKSYGDEGLNNKYMDNESISESKAYKNFK